MPTQVEVFASILSSVAAGAASQGKDLAASAVTALTQRYFVWTVTPGEDEGGQRVESTPQEVWDAPQGAMLRGKFAEIGRLAAEAAAANGQSKVDGAEIDTASQTVEDDSDCPWCR